MRGIQTGIHGLQACGSRLTHAFGGRPAAVALFTAWLLAPELALADSAIDAGVQPYFIFGGWGTALVFLGIGCFILQKALQNRRMAEAAMQWPTTDGMVVSAAVIKRVSKSQDE